MGRERECVCEREKERERERPSTRAMSFLSRIRHISESCGGCSNSFGTSLSNKSVIFFPGCCFNLQGFTARAGGLLR